MTSVRGDRLLALAVSVALGLASLSGCNDVGDQICNEGTNPNDLNDGCPYGPPGGPKIREEGCADVEQLSDAECTGAPTWTTDVWPLLTTQAPLGQNCALQGCHGSGAGALTLPEADAAQAFVVLKSYTPEANYPYISDTNPEHTWILCNLNGTKGGRSPMPPPPNFPMPTQTLLTVELWAQCGQKLGP